MAGLARRRRAVAMLCDRLDVSERWACRRWCEFQKASRLDSVGMSVTWSDEYLTVNEIAEHLKLNPQTVRNWIDNGSLPAVRIGRRVRVRRVDLEHVLQQGTTVSAKPSAAGHAPVNKLALLHPALSDAQRLLGRRSAARRTELADALYTLTHAVAEFVRAADANEE